MNEPGRLEEFGTMKNIEGWAYMRFGALLNGSASIFLKYSAMQKLAVQIGQIKASVFPRGSKCPA